MKGAAGRFERENVEQDAMFEGIKRDDIWYKVPRPGMLWNGSEEEPLAADGGKERQKKEVVEVEASKIEIEAAD